MKKLAGRIVCLSRGNLHQPVRKVLGNGLTGFVCSVCDKPGADYDSMGYHDGGYIDPVRQAKKYERQGSKWW